MKENKKKWTRPQLIVLGRGTPEENVLSGCKTSKLSGISATKTNCKKGGLCGTNKCKVVSTS